MFVDIYIDSKASSSPLYRVKCEAQHRLALISVNVQTQSGQPMILEDKDLETNLCFITPCNIWKTISKVYYEHDAVL